jgi:hypothetical protein
MEKGRLRGEGCYSVPPTGSLRTRMRLSSMTTMLPCTMASSMAERLARRSRDCASGLLDPRRKRMTEGFLSSRKAKRVPKSVSAEIRVRSSLAARANISWSVPFPCHSGAHERHRGPQPAGPLRPRATKHCPQEISRTTGHREFALADRFSGITQCFTDVFKLEVRICLENLGLCHPFAHHPDDSGDRDAQSADAGNSAHLIGLHRNSLEYRHLDLPFRGPRANRNEELSLSKINMPPRLTHL